MNVKVDISTGKSITFEALRLQAESAARHLIGRYRCRFGDVIAIFGANSIEWVVFALAAFRVGAVLTAFNSQLKQGQVIAQVVSELFSNASLQYHSIFF